jgi:hypothetical protein
VKATKLAIKLQDVGGKPMTGFSPLALAAFGVLGVLLVWATLKIEMWLAYRAHNRAMVATKCVLAEHDEDE